MITSGNKCAYAAIDFFQEVRSLAEAEGHHPDLHLVQFRNVQVRLIICYLSHCMSLV